MEKVSYSDGKKEAIVTFDGDEITVELIKGFPLELRQRILQTFY